MRGDEERRVIFHPDPLCLERELGARIREVKQAAGPWARILVTVPTQRQALRIRERLAESEHALLGVEVLQYQALAYRLLESSEAPPSLLADSVLERLIDRLLRSRRDSVLSVYARERPGVLAELRARLAELREAGVVSSDLVLDARPGQTQLFAHHEPDGREPLLHELSALLEAFDEALKRLETRGWTDRPGLARRAARECSLRFEAVFAYGAYEIVGSHLGLLNALSTARPLTFFVPADPEAPAWAHARDQARRFFAASVEPMAGDPARDFVDAARGLFDADARKPAASPRITLAHAQGPEAELTQVVRRVLALVEDGVPPREIAVIARTLDPYVALGESVFARHRLPVDASRSMPLARYAEPRALLLFLRALSGNFERRAVTELVRSSHLVRPDWARDTPLWRPVSWERWSRTYGLTSGLEPWTTDLPRLVRERSAPPWMENAAEIEAFEAQREDDARSADLLGRLVLEWAALGDAWSRCRRAPDHVALLERLRRTWIKPVHDGTPESAALDHMWGGALNQLEALEAILEPDPLDRETVLDFVNTALESALLPSSHPEGVAFLDLRQARGLIFRHTFFIGMNDGIYPQPLRETPLLPDRVRRAVRDRTGKPLAVRREGRAEERLLFAQLVASTRESLTVSWQRADAEGRALAPSLALRDLGRILPGAPSLAALLENEGGLIASLPTEPTLSAEWLEREPGLLLREEAALLSARGAPAAGLCAFLEAIDPELGRDLASGITLIDATENGEQLSFDGAIQPASGWSRPFSASSLEQLARCPLTFFFRNVLGARPLDQEAREYRTEAREIGQLVHRILEAVYRDLAQAGLLEGGAESEALKAAGRAGLEKHWDRVLEPLASRMNRRYPLLYATTARIWKEELEQFLDKDLARLAEGGHRLESLEATWNVPIPLGPGGDGEVAFTGVPDRVTRDSSGTLWISDYKTSGKLEKFTQPSHYLCGEYVQLPLYVLMALCRDRASTRMPEAEVVGLGPNFFPNFGFVGRGPNRFDLDDFMKVDSGFRETLRVLSGLVDRGRFPFRSGHHCRWCDFHLACRRHQFSSELRVVEHPEHRDYYRMKDKTKTKPMLEDVAT